MPYRHKGAIFTPIVRRNSHYNLHLQVFWVFKSTLIFESGSSLDLDHHGTSSLDLDHHWASSLDLDHHCWIIITGSRSSLDLDHHHWCYLMILLVTGSSTEPTPFHVGCRPSLHVGLLQHLYLINTWSKKGSSFLSDQHMIKERLQHLYLINMWSNIDTALTSDQHMIKERLIISIWSTHDWI